MTPAAHDLRALYRAAQVHEAPTPEDRRAVRASLAGAMATVAAHGATAGAALGAGGGSAVKALTVTHLAGWLIAGTLASGAVASLVVATKAPPEPAANVMQGSPAPSSSAAFTVLRRKDPTPSEALGPPGRSGQAEPSNSRGLPSDLTGAKSQARRPTALPSSPPSLSAESQGLAEVQRALNAGAADTALLLLNEQETQFGVGVLGEERAAARVLALCAGGRTTDAEAARERFLSSYPDSPLVKRVRKCCVE